MECFSSLSIADFLLIEHLILYPWLIIPWIPNNMDKQLFYLAIGYTFILSYLGNLSSSA